MSVKHPSGDVPSVPPLVSYPYVSSPQEAFKSLNWKNETEWSQWNSLSMTAALHGACRGVSPSICLLQVKSRFCYPKYWSCYVLATNGQLRYQKSRAASLFNTVHMRTVFYIPDCNTLSFKWASHNERKKHASWFVSNALASTLPD